MVRPKQRKRRQRRKRDWVELAVVTLSAVTAIAGCVQHFW
ncbi:hypothetical protein S1361_19185 [Streptomyces cyanogenus]|uniref:Lipoprotein n=1 Tax=Streptomyces cyanogenus TaxID=80860 RepID=A0ABX7TS94_STRCY|nr:hypothetical protein S1361_19185 [Streptomyces cyanogenus]